MAHSFSMSPCDDLRTALMSVLIRLPKRIAALFSSRYSFSPIHLRFLNMVLLA
jgi:hypothetical protein